MATGKTGGAIYTPRKKKTTPAMPSRFDDLGGTFTPGGFVPNKQKVALPPDAAPYKHGQSPVQQRTSALAGSSEVRVIDKGPSPAAAQRAAQTMALQRMLVAKGAKISVDGQWGPQTESAYQAFLHHSAQAATVAQHADASQNPVNVHEQLLLKQEEQQRTGQPSGLIVPGNINLNDRPIVHNADGSYSTVRSITITDGGKAILIPTVVGGRVVSNEQAIQHYQQTGQHLGVFDSEADADAYAQSLHERQAAQYGARAQQQPEAKPAETYSDTKRSQPRFPGEPVAGYEGRTSERGPQRPGVPFYTDAHTHATTRGQVAEMQDTSQFQAQFGTQTETDLEQTPKVASPALTGTLEAVGGALPGVGLARAAEAGHLTGGAIAGEAANDLLWLGPGELAAPFKMVGAAIKAGRTGEDIGQAAKTAVKLWHDKRLARIQNPIVRRDIESSPDRASFIAALDATPKLSGTEKHALVQVADHNAVARSAQTGEKPSIAWGKANFGKSTFHDLNPTRGEALGALGQPAHFQQGDLTAFPRFWENPASVKDLKDMFVRPGGVPFVSKLHMLVADMPEKVGVQELLGKIKSAGVKGDEIRWNHFDEFLASATGKGQKSITREEALSWLDKSYLKIEENRRFQPPADRYGNTPNDPNSNETKFGSYTLPGGPESNYQEFTIRLPQDQYGDLYTYTGHYPDANILAHARTTDRIVADDHTLMIEEIQSDWHQAGQKQGYKTPVTEHPDYEATTHKLDEAIKDVEAITSTLRRRISDALLTLPETANMPEHLTAAFERSAETQLGINATDGNSLTTTNKWMDRIDDFIARYGEEGFEAVAVPANDHESRVVLHHNGGPVGDHHYDSQFGMFASNSYDKSDYAQKSAEEQARKINNYIHMRPADRRSVRDSIAALHSGLTARYHAQQTLRHLEESASHGVAQGPFAKTWHELAFKRMLAEAVDKGYERIAWTTGRTQAERYNLANFFKRIEITEASGGGSSDELYDWADQRAQYSVDDMTDEDLGLDDRKLEELREDAGSNVDYPSEDDYYVIEDENGNTTPADPEDEGAILDEEAHQEALDEYLDNVDSKYEELVDEYRSDAREHMLEAERQHYMENAGEYDDSPKEGALEVKALSHDSGWHSYRASTDSSDENALENIVGPDLATRYFENGETEFEGDALVAGENAKSALGASHFYDNKLTGFVNKYLKQTGVQSSMETIGGAAPDRFEGATFKVRKDGLAPNNFWVEAHWPNGDMQMVGSQESLVEANRLADEWQGGAHRALPSPGAGTIVHSIPVTDEVRKFVDQGIVLFQRDPLVKEIAKAQKLAPRMKGAVQLGDKSSLHLFKSADVSTVVHEMGHVVQQSIPSLAHLDPEAFARSFEQYFMKAKAPTKNLVLPFAEIDQAMRRVYGTANKIPGARLSPLMKRELDLFFKTAEKEHPEVFRALVATHFQAAWSDHEGSGAEVGGEAGRGMSDLAKPSQADMLEAAKVQAQMLVKQGIHADDAVRTTAGMFRVDEDALRAVMGDTSTYDRIHSNADVGTGTAAEVDARHDTQFQEGEPEPIQDDSLANTYEPADAEKPLEPEEALRQGMKGVAFRRAAQNQARSEERARRAGAYEGALRGGSGMEGARNALAELKGELPKIDYGGFKELTPEALDHLVDVVRDHPHLMPFQKARLIEALDKATRGELPTEAEQQLIEHVFGKDTASGFKAIASMPEHIQNLIAEVLNVPRSVMASFDLSAPFRQGLVIGTRHPRIFFRNFATMLKSFKSEDYYQALVDDVKQRPSYPMMVDAKLAITDMEALNTREEQFYSNLAERITGGKKSPIRMSGRAYTAFLMKTRADVFDHLIRVAEKQGKNVQEEKFLHDLGRYINAATGRGNLGVLTHAAPTLNTVFFSPRLLASRLDLLFSPITYARADPFVRKQALVSMLHLVGVSGTILGLASFLPGVTVNLDPRNADFGKIRVGNTRLDILGGFQQPVRLISQFTSGTIISSTTGDPLSLGPQGPGAVSRRDIVQRFFEGKLAPVPSIVNDWMKGTDFTGQPYSWKREALQHMTPLLAQDATDLYFQGEKNGQNGIALALGGYAVGAWGFGIQTYGPKNPATKPTTKLQKEAKEAGLGAPTKALLIDVEHKANLDTLSQKHKGDPQGRLDAYIKYYADTTGDHSFDKWVGAKLDDNAAEAGAANIRAAMVGSGLSQYESAIKAALAAQEKK